MLQDSIKLIGKKQNPRKDSLLASLKEVDGLIFIYENDFEVWSNFDKWENIFFQRWVFEKALEALTEEVNQHEDYLRCSQNQCNQLLFWIGFFLHHSHLLLDVKTPFLLMNHKNLLT